MVRISSSEEFKDYKHSLKNVFDKKKLCVRICMTGCRAYGSELVRDAFKEQIDKKALGDKVEIRETGCHGFCAKAAVVAIDPQNIFYQQVAPEDVKDIVEKTLIEGKKLTRLLYSENGRRIMHARNIPFFKGQVINVLSNCGKIDPTDINQYIYRQGYTALARVLFSMSEDEVVETVKKSGLRGRGGAGFPTGIKWSFMKAAPGKIKYIICNADEGDPGAFMDRAILEGDPHCVIEGMLIGAYAMGATEGYIYVRAEYPIAVEHLHIAIEDAEKMGFLGERILGTDFNFKLKLKEGAGAFVCGEETALMASIEGRRGMPRPRPPFPAQAGLWGKPTNINNVETWANIRHIILKGHEWFAGMGTEGSKGTKIFSLAGRVINTGLVEVPIGIKVRDVVFDIGGGIANNRKFKAVQMGGPSGGCVPSEHLDLPIDYDSLEKIGAIMGSGGMVVMDESSCMVDIARFFISFTQSESCGKCSPCRMGTKRMFEILTRITQGNGREEDIALLEEMGRSIKDSALCGLGQTAPNPVLSTIRYFRDEYMAHIREKRCPAAVCEGLVYAPCEHTCPVNVDAVGYISLIAEKRLIEALNLIRLRNPLPGVCGRICNHPCERRCKRGEIDEPIAICHLKRVPADYGMRHRVKTSVPVESPKEERVAVVGSGPAGLNCAYHLARKGYRTTIYEALPVIGGMMRVGIPDYRLPPSVVDYDVEFIKGLGVEIKTNSAVGLNGFSLQSLFDAGYKAVFTAIGAHRGLKLKIPGEDLEGVFDGVSFLRKVNLQERVNVGKKAVVVGGGNVAIDTSRTLLRLGVGEVTIIYRRTRAEMPALDEEIEEAHQEGVAFNYLVAPVRIIGTNSAVSAIECERMKLGEYDKSGRRRPVPIKDSLFTIDADMVVTAIGQVPDIASIDSGAVLQRGRAQTIEVDPETLQTNIKGVFAGGDAVTGPSMVIEAMAQGEKAAISIDKYLRGVDLKKDRIRKPDMKYFLPKASDEEEMGEKPRVRIKTIPIKKRKQCFDEVNCGYSLVKAVEEARRCLRCDLEK